jgi:hypothetical protein
MSELDIYDEDEEPHIKRCTPQSRKLGKKWFCVQKYDSFSFSVSLIDNRYPVVKCCVSHLDYRECSSMHCFFEVYQFLELDHCKVLWIDKNPSFEILLRMTNQQCLSRFPQMRDLCQFISLNIYFLP